MPSELTRRCGRSRCTWRIAALPVFLVEHTAHELVGKDVLEVVQNDLITLGATHELDDLRGLVGDEDVAGGLVLVKVGPSVAERKGRGFLTACISSVCAGSRLRRLVVFPVPLCPSTIQAMLICNLLD